MFILQTAQPLPVLLEHPLASREDALDTFGWRMFVLVDPGLRLGDDAFEACLAVGVQPLLAFYLGNLLELVLGQDPAAFDLLGRPDRRLARSDGVVEPVEERRRRRVTAGRKMGQV